MDVVVVVVVVAAAAAAAVMMGCPPEYPACLCESCVSTAWS